jgi:hypothetical protein
MIWVVSKFFLWTFVASSYVVGSLSCYIMWVWRRQPSVGGSDLHEYTDGYSLVCC